MGSAKQPETLQLLKQDAVPEDALQPSTSLPCSQEKDISLQHIRCDGGDLTMRNCCVNDLGTKDGSQKDTMVDNPDQKEKERAVSTKPSVELVTATRTVGLKDTMAGGTPLEEDGERAAHHSSSCRDLPSSLSNTCNPLESKAVPGDTHTHLTAEPCLKGANKDPSSAPASLKHVAFLEPTKKTAEAESIQAGTAHSEESPALPTCLKNTSQGQLGASKGDTSHFSSDVCEAADHSSEGHGGPLVSEAPKESTQDPLAAEATSGKSSRPATEADQLGHSGEVRFPAQEANTGGNSSRVPGNPVAAIPHEAKGTSGESQTTPGEATKEAEGLREATSSESKGQNQAQEKQTPETTSVAVSEDCTTGVEKRSVELLTQTCSLEVTPPQHDAGTQVDNRVSLVSVAVSPINPPDGSSAFTFHTRGLGASPSLKSPDLEQKPAKRDAEMQVSIPVETRSVATGPMTPVTKSPQASYPEVHVKGAQEEAPEPVREVSWDEKGMTWEVYGASMEVEVLGMAIQKHLEKQIEEHGRQMVMTPQSTRASSIKGAPPKGEVKRQPSVFRALLQNVRRPRCCSRGGPTVE